MTASSSGLLKDDGDRRTLSRSLLSTNMSCSRAANLKKKTEDLFQKFQWANGQSRLSNANLIKYNDRERKKGIVRKIGRRRS